jgi:hypothetical protein
VVTEVGHQRVLAELARVELGDDVRLLRVHATVGALALRRPVGLRREKPRRSPHYMYM